MSKTAISNARKKYPEARFDVATLESFEPPDSEGYDVIVFNEVLSQIARPLDVIDRFSTMLKPKGFIAISIYQNPDEYSNARLFTQMFDAEIAAG